MADREGGEPLPKRQRRNAIKPNSVEADMIREVGKPSNGNTWRKLTALRGAQQPGEYALENMPCTTVIWVIAPYLSVTILSNVVRETIIERVCVTGNSVRSQIIIARAGASHFRLDLIYTVTGVTFRLDQMAVSNDVPNASAACDALSRSGSSATDDEGDEDRVKDEHQQPQDDTADASSRTRSYLGVIFSENHHESVNSNHIAPSIESAEQVGANIPNDADVQTRGLPNAIDVLDANTIASSVVPSSMSAITSSEASASSIVVEMLPNGP
jgi:hypothetical protein